MTLRGGALLISLILGVSSCGGGGAEERDAKPPSEELATRNRAGEEPGDSQGTGAGLPQGDDGGGEGEQPDGDATEVGGGETRQTGPSTSSTTLAAEPNLKATVEKPCVHPGDLQRLSVHAEPGAGVIYDTVYSDGTNQLTTDYGDAGSGRGFANDDGEFEATWKVAPNAPPGRAKVNVGASGSRGFVGPAGAVFTIARPGEICPDT